MSEYCVVVAGGAEARIFSLEPAELPEMESGPNLVEREVLLNPEKGTAGGELWSDAKSGRNRGPGGAHGYDDHRDRHAEEFDRRFARELARMAAEQIKRLAAEKLILVAEKRMLGHLRGEVEGLGKLGVTVQECAKELSRLSPLDLHGHLARENLLPERRAPGA